MSLRETERWFHERQVWKVGVAGFLGSCRLSGSEGPAVCGDHAGRLCGSVAVAGAVLRCPNRLCLTGCAVPARLAGPSLRPVSICGPMVMCV